MLLRVFHVFHTCRTLFFRLKELNFEVETHNNLKQVEVLEKISKGKHMRHLYSNDPEQQDNHVRANT